MEERNSHNWRSRNLPSSIRASRGASIQDDVKGERGTHLRGKHFSPLALFPKS